MRQKTANNAVVWIINGIYQLNSRLGKAILEDKFLILSQGGCVHTDTRSDRSLTLINTAPNAGFLNQSLQITIHLTVIRIETHEDWHEWKVKQKAALSKTMN